jgi:hypothetical protein
MKMELYKVIKLIKDKDKNKMTYKDIANKTGYHVKSLTRLNNKLKNDTKSNVLIHGNKGKIPYNKMSVEEKDKILLLKQKYETLNNTMFYKKYKIECEENHLKARSYTTINFLLNKNISSKSLAIKDKESIILKCIIVKYKSIRLRLYIAIDIQTKNILKIEFSKYSSSVLCCEILRQILINNGVPKKIYVHGSLIIRNPMYGKTEFARICDELNIDIDYELNYEVEKIFKAIKKEILDKLNKSKKDISNIKQLNELFYTEGTNVSYERKKKSEELKYIICLKEERKIIQNNNIQIHNNFYKIITNDYEVLPKGTKTQVMQNFERTWAKVIINEKVYDTILLTKKYSKKFYD